MLQFYSKVYQYALKKSSSAYTTQNSPKLDKPLPLSSFVLHRSFKAIHFLTQNGKTSHTHRNHLIPFYPKILSLLTLSHTMNKIVKCFKNLIRQTIFKMTYILHMIFLNLMIMLLMTTHSLRIMTINQLCLKIFYTNL